MPIRKKATRRNHKHRDYARSRDEATDLESHENQRNTRAADGSQAGRQKVIPSPQTRHTQPNRRRAKGRQQPSTHASRLKKSTSASTSIPLNKARRRFAYHSIRSNKFSFCFSNNTAANSKNNIHRQVFALAPSMSSLPLH